MKKRKSKIEPLNIQLARKAKIERFRKEFDLYATEINNDCPIIIQRGAVLLDNISGNRFLQLKLSNTSEKEVRSAYIKLNCLDDTGDIVGNIVDIAYSDINCKKDICFGDKVLSSIPYAAKVFRFEEIKVAYADGTSERFGKEGFHSIPEVKPLKAVVDSEHYGYLDSQKNLCAQPESITDTMCRCICGGLMTESGKCANCGRDFQQAVYDANHISELHANHLAEETKKQREREQKELTAKYQKHLNISSIVACALFLISVVTDMTGMITGRGVKFTFSNVIFYSITLLTAVAILRQNKKLLVCGVAVKLLYSLRTFKLIISMGPFIERWQIIQTGLLIVGCLCLLIGIILVIKAKAGKIGNILIIIALVSCSVVTLLHLMHLNRFVDSGVSGLSMNLGYVAISVYLLLQCHILKCTGTSGNYVDSTLQGVKAQKPQGGSESELSNKIADGTQKFNDVKENNIKPFIANVQQKSKVLMEKAADKAHEITDKQGR